MFTKNQLNQLYQYGYSLTLDSDDAYDLVQTGIEKYLVKKINVKNKVAYIRRIMRNQFIDQQRRKKIIPFESLDDNNNDKTLAIDTTSLEEIIISQNEIDCIWSMLTISEREIVYLWALQGFTAKQISDETGVPRGTILSKIHRLREKIIHKFDKLNPKSVRS